MSPDDERDDNVAEDKLVPIGEHCESYPSQRFIAAECFTNLLEDKDGEDKHHARIGTAYHLYT